MNANDSNSDHSCISYREFYIYTLMSQGSILVANVYANKVGEWLLRGSLLPCYKKLKTANFPRDWRLPQFNLTFKNFSVS